MAAEITGTPTALIVSGSPASSDGGGDYWDFNVTVPSDAVMMVVTASIYGGGIQGMNRVTSSFFSGDATLIGPYSPFDDPADVASFAYAEVTATGSQSVSLRFSDGTSRIEGPTVWIFFVRDCEVEGFLRDWAAINDGAGNATVDSSEDDLVIADDAQSGSPPGTPSGWTSLGTTSNNSIGSRLSRANTPGASSTSVQSQGGSFAILTLMSIRSEDGPPPPPDRRRHPLLMLPF